MYKPDYKSLLNDIQEILQGRLLYLSCQVCFSVEGLLMGAWDTDEEKLELWGIELQKLHLYKQLKARWYSVQMFPISKNSLEPHLLLTSTNSAYNFSSTWRIAEIKKMVLVKKEKCIVAQRLWNKSLKGFCQARVCLWHLIHKIERWNNWFLLTI